MLIEKNLEDALKAYKKGKKVVVLQEFEDGSLDTCPMEDYIDDKTHFLVDVPACENPDWNKAMHEMVIGGSQAPEESKVEKPQQEEQKAEEPAKEEVAQNFSGGAVTNAPEAQKENKFKVVKDLTEQGKSAKEIAEITGYGKNLIYQYQYKINKEQKSESEPVTPGHNADRHLCRTCTWRSNDNNIKSDNPGCEYSVRNNHSRGCKVEDCNVYKKGDPKKSIKPLTL